MATFGMIVVTGVVEESDRRRPNSGISGSGTERAIVRNVAKENILGKRIIEQSPTTREPRCVLCRQRRRPNRCAARSCCNPCCRADWSAKDRSPRLDPIDRRDYFSLRPRQSNPSACRSSRSARDVARKAVLKIKAVVIFERVTLTVALRFFAAARCSLRENRR